MNGKTYRLFTALDVTEEIRKQIKTFQCPIKGLKWMPLEQVHLTLNFIGNTDEESYDRIKRNLGNIALPPFSLCLYETGFFPRKSRPSVFWLGLEDSPALALLKEQLDNTLEATGFPKEERKFSPHITIARIKGHFKPASTEQLESKFKDFPKHRFEVPSFSLYSSLLTQEGAIHKKEKEYILSPPPEN